MNRQEFEDTARRYREELFRMYASQNITPPPKPESPPVQTSPAVQQVTNLPDSPEVQPVSADLPPDSQDHSGVNADGLPVFPEPDPARDLPQMPAPKPNQDAPGLPKRDYTGIIRVHVTTAMGTRPVVGAAVLIQRMFSDREPELIAVQNTDESGEIRPVTVPAPPPSENQRKPAYFLYDVDVQAGGYYRERSTDVPVFPGITSVQNFDMIPLPAGTDEPVPGGGITYYNQMQQY